LKFRKAFFLAAQEIRNIEYLIYTLKRIMTLYDKQTLNWKEWQQLIENSASSSWFQTPEAYDFYSSLNFLQSFVFGVAENDKLTGIVSGFIQSEGGILRKYFSRRAIVNGGALLSNNISDEALKQLLTYTRHELKKQAIYIEIRNFKDFSGFKSNFEKAGFSYFPHLNFHVPTPDLETCLKNLHASKRRDIKLSQKNGVEWGLSSSKKDLESFYSLLKNLYSTKVKTPLFPVEYFERLMDRPNGRIFIAKYNDEVIGGSACVAFDNRILYEMFVCGMDGKYKNIYPSTAATWAAIEYAAVNGYDYFDMMGAGKPSESYGVREFKSRFGGTLVEYGRFLCVNNVLLYRLGEFVVRMIKKQK